MPRLRASLLTLLLVLVAGFSGTGDGAGTVTGSDGPTAAAAYYLVGGDASDVGAERVAIEQKGKQFEPDLAAVAVGGVAAFPNRDDVVHNVYSPKGVLGFFDMGSAEKTAADDDNLLKKTVTKEGVVHVACAIHPVMKGLLFVVPSKYYAVSRDGSYAIAGAPAGSYDLMVMQEDGTVTKLKSVTVD